MEKDEETEELFKIFVLFFIRRWTFDVRCWTFFFQNNLTLMEQGIEETLSQDLQKEFPDMKGFSAQNLWRMKQVYETYKNNNKLSTLLREIPWSHNILILHYTETLEEKEFYMKTCSNEQRWFV